MAEEKKDSFTFSDKIKGSKPGFNPFSKRGSSKIGSNGKPKKTLFDRTRRDAPFFIAAILALLLLPFLYKYSGSVHDDYIMTPGAEDSVFDPERFGFAPSMEDPSDQIAQLAGSDPLSLIKGWGTPEEKEPDYSLDRDGLDDRDYTPAPRRQEEPVSAYRQSAPAATRAAFQRRTPTKINEIRGASLNMRGGGGIGSRFGGANLKAAAKQDSGGAPKKGIKPVSLQPLRAAGSPSRSYFGQSGAAQARASRDAMGKSNAAQALRDAMFAPIENGRIGGLGDGVFAAGGGAGKFDRHMDFKGITPWWWDMMKQQEMEKWKWKYFLWRKNLVEPLIKGLAEVLVDFGKGLSCCLLTGEDDCSMGSMWGTKAGQATPGGCKINKVTYTTVDELKAAYPNAPIAGDIKKWCQAMEKNTSQEYGKVEWVAEKGAGGNLGPISKRLNCMGGSFKGKTKGSTEVTESQDCEGMAQNNFRLYATGESKNWNKYIAVVAKNYSPNPDAPNDYLCAKANINWNKRSAGAVGDIAEAKNSQSATAKIATRKHTDHEWTTKPKNKGDKYDENSMNINDRDAIDNACVIYVAETSHFSYEDFTVKTITMLGELARKNKWSETDGKKLFPQLHLYFIEGFVMKDTLAKGSSATTDTVPEKSKYNQGMPSIKHIPAIHMPMVYSEFEDLYVLHRNKASVKNFKDKKLRSYQSRDIMGLSRPTGDTGDVDAYSVSCAFSPFQIKAETIWELTNVCATLTYDPDIHGAKAENITVTATVPGANNMTVNAGSPQAVSGKSAHYCLPLAQAQIQTLNTALQNEKNNGELVFQWKAVYKQQSSMDNATYSGDAIVHQIPPTEAECTEGQSEQKTIDGCSYTRTCVKKKGKPTWGEYTKDDPTCTGSKTYITFKHFIHEIDGQPFSSCAGADNISNKQLVAVDNDIKALLATAKEKYNASHTDTQLEYSEDCVTIANLVDAMHIVQGEISLNAVCMLGKSVGANSQDPTVRQDGGNAYNNMFGAFAAYMGEYSAYFPAPKLTKDSGSVDNDPRFQWCCGGRTSSVKALQIGSHPEYHYGNYVWAKEGIRPHYKNELSNGIWQGAPLEKIATNISWKPNGVATDKQIQQDRRAYHEQYAKVFGPGSCRFNSNLTMNYQEVAKYLKAICKEGRLQKKPSHGIKSCKCQGSGDNNSGGANNGPTGECQGAAC